MLDVVKKLVQALEDKTSHDLVVETYGPSDMAGSSPRQQFVLGQDTNMLGFNSDRKERKTVLARKQSTG